MGGGPISSAAVFNSSGQLVRTLWSARVNDPRILNPVAAWDGTTDDITTFGSTPVAPTGTYTIKVYQHNISYQWNGPIGNTTPVADHSGRVDYHFYENIINSMVVTSTEIYFCYNNDERIMNARFMSKTDIQHSSPWFPPQGFRTSIAGMAGIVTDGTLTYIGVSEFGDSFVLGGVNSTKAFTTSFTSGTSNGSHLSERNDSGFNGNITGLAVQGSGSFICIARVFLNTVFVCNKTTGAAVSSFTGLNGPGSTVINPATITQLWIANDPTSTGASFPTITKCAIDGSGNITTTATTITVGDCRAMAISPDGNTLLVCDASTSSMQVKAYNTSDGSVKTAFGTSGAFGTAGGYTNSPAITNTKFMFYDLVGASPSSFICFDPTDSSFWLGDPGNYRYLHFSSGNSPTLSESFAYIPTFYVARLCRNDSTRVFANLIEFQIDYTKTLGPGNGSWTAVNNWAGNLITNPSANLNSGSIVLYLKYVGTYSNGRTYGVTNFPNAAWHRIWELTSTGLRNCFVAFWPTQYMDKNMNFFSGPQVSGGSQATIFENALSSFDVNGNPVYSVLAAAQGGILSGYSLVPDFGNVSGAPSLPLIFTSNTLPTFYPTVFGQDNNAQNPTDLTLSGYWPLLDPSQNFICTVGVINRNNGIPVAATSFSTPPNDGGKHNFFLNFPPMPFQPGRLGPGSANAICYIPGDQHFFTVFHGEQWGNLQTNKIMHWHETGVALGSFGPVAPYFAITSLENPAGWNTATNVANNPSSSPYSFRGLTGMAGNVGKAEVANVGGTYFLYEPDEFYHGGVARWEIDNISSLQITNVTVNWNSANFVSVSDPTDLLASLPFNTVMPVGTTGKWTVTDADVEPGSTRFHVWTSVMSPDPRKVDISLDSAFRTDTNYHGMSTVVTRLGTGNWQITGSVMIQPGVSVTGNMGDQGNIFFDVLDTNGNIIIRWFGWFNPVAIPSDPSGSAGTVTVNTTNLFPVPSPQLGHGATTTYLGAIRSFSIVANVAAGTLGFTYDIYSASALQVFQAGALIGQPKTIRIAFNNLVSGGPFVGQPAWCVNSLHFTETMPMPAAGTVITKGLGFPL